jgi:pimeloyl-ACP methyl ester carboxylesterase
MHKRTRTTVYFLLGLAMFISGCVSEAVYHPTRTIRSTPADIKLSYEDITLETTDKLMLSAWWVPAADPEGTVLFCHGNAGNMGDRLDTLQIINTLGLNVLIFDYRGYGRSEGSPSEKGTYLDAEAAWNYLVDEKEIAPQQIIVWGRSLGGAIAARTAAHH